MTSETSCASRSEIPSELAQLRQSIDNIDAALIFMLAERFRCTEAVGVLKATSHLPATDAEREKNQLARLRTLAETAGLDPVVAEKFFNCIVQAVVQRHKELAKTLTP